ncbi:MAG: hypothetical protein HOE80_03425 [Candidatus Magasanikbacteria bacterium]|jgi:hypothetical protein|nr:hypothetical protein [Candidatus Magasanikbacteria bacterium]MBT4071748.1 hypothetical protein [Candidatus Magasanikbacteria bacterium]
MKKTFTTTLLIALCFITIGCTKTDVKNNTEQEETDTIEIIDEVEDMDVKETEINIEKVVYDWEGDLEDVTKGKTILGVNTEGTSSGFAQAVFNNTYTLQAVFEGLPDPEGTDFYEGWIVRREGSFNVISTGKASKIDGVYKNVYESEKDLSDHTFYVLTIEPDDGDPAPAEHILEGVLMRN